MKQIRIQGKLVGIIGLESVIATMAENYAARADEDIGKEMIERLSIKNYIPERARELYKAALVREFRQYLGQPVAEAPICVPRVVILGPGCAQCDRMETDVREVMAEMQLAAELDHVTDIREISRYGVLGLPALIINDKVVCVGQVPNRNRIREWLQEGQKQG